MAAAACTAMDAHDRRLSISKASASKISKPSSHGVLKSLSSTSPSSSSTPQLPSSIASSPSRPIAKVVNADPSSFRRVVQELTGTNLPASHVSSVSRPPSRLQRIAPPPLRTQLPPQRHLTLLEQMQHQQSSHHHHHHHHHHHLQLEQPEPQVGTSNPNPNSTQSLPMLSPHLLSPLPALTPGDNTWAHPIEAMSAPLSTAANLTLPPLLPLPAITAQSRGHGAGLLSARPGPPALMLSSAQGQALPPLLATPPSPQLMFPLTSSLTVLPPWSPSAFPGPFSPGLFPPSPGPGLSSSISPGNMNSTKPAA